MPRTASWAWLLLAAPLLAALVGAAPQARDRDCITVTEAVYTRASGALSVTAKVTGAPETVKVYATHTETYIGSLDAADGRTYSAVFHLDEAPANITVRAGERGAASMDVEVR